MRRGRRKQKLAPNASDPDVLIKIGVYPLDYVSSDPEGRGLPYSTAWERRGVVWTFWGIVTGDELMRSNQEIYGDERFDEMAYQIVDLILVESFEVTQDDMAVIAANDKAAARSNPKVRVAVAARDALIKQLSAFYESANVESPWNQEVFDSLSDARAWLGQPLESPRNLPGR